MSASKFYSYGKLLSRNGVFNAVCGGRGIGKSFGGKELAIKKAITKGEQFIYLRRYKEELALSAGTFFNDIVARGLFPDYHFRKWKNEAQCTKDPEFTSEGEPNKKRKWVTIGYFHALSTAQNYKSMSYPDVHWILFDEFIVEKGRQYLRGSEVDTLLNFYDTVDRGEDRVRVLMMANAVSIDNPYFLAWDIIPDGKEWYTRNEGFIVAHFPELDDFNDERRETRFGRFINETEYGRFAIDNVFADAHDGLVGKKSDKARYLYTIDTLKGRFSLWFDTITGEWAAQTRRPRAGETVFTLVPHHVRDDVVYITKTDNRLEYPRRAARNGRMLFDSPKTRNVFLELFK